jgi:hypothetical protein
MKEQSTSFSESAFEKRLGKIDEAIVEEDWLSGFTLAVTYFEHYGYWATILHCYREKVELTNKARESLKMLGAVQLALLLRVTDLISAETYSNMKKIIEERNKIVHPARKSIFYADSKKRDEAVRLLTQAKECLKAIKGTVKATWKKKT